MIVGAAVVDLCSLVACSRDGTGASTVCRSGTRPEKLLGSCREQPPSGGRQHLPRACEAFRPARGGLSTAGDIPAPAGPTRATARSARTPRDHPRGCGGRLHALTTPVRQTVDHPRACGADSAAALTFDAGPAPRDSVRENRPRLFVPSDRTWRLGPWLLFAELTALWQRCRSGAGPFSSVLVSLGVRI